MLDCEQADLKKMPPGWPQETKSDSARLLGSEHFRQRFNIDCAYAAGAMYQGIASPDLVMRMANAGLIGFFGAAGLSLDAIEKAIMEIKDGLAPGRSFGINLHANPADLQAERATVLLYLKHGICYVEAAAFTQMTPALVHYGLHGLKRGLDGRIARGNRILAKASRPEVATAYMSPPPAAIVELLLRDGSISEDEAALSQAVPMSSDICVEADSGGHTDGGVPTVLLPAMLALRDEVASRSDYQESICVGLAGGIGEPRAAASAFIMGADFILTGSINQCSAESGASDVVKELLQSADVQDTAYAPAGDLFETGSQVQVLRRGVFFAARAQKLYSIYMQYDGLDHVPSTVKQQLERNYFGMPLKDVWVDCQRYLQQSGRGSEIALVEANPKRKMAQTFKWYFKYSSDLARRGDTANKVNFQVHTGPAIGAFNRWVKGSAIEHWRARHVDEMGYALMAGAHQIIGQARAMANEGDPAPA
jgi:trans-AT polyketide synthase/acyltransferase/oxidoreductase domain-containing protein